MPEKVLIIDDESDFIELLRVILSRKGYQVLAAATGAEATISIAENCPSIVLLDYMLPDISGLDLLPRLKEASPVSKIIVITARGSEEIAVELMKSGASDYLKKPFDSEKLLTTIDNVLKLRSSEAAVDKLNKELLAQNRELLSLHAMSSLLASNIADKEKYTAAVGIVMKNMNGDMVNLFLYDDERRLRLYASEGTDVDNITECNHSSRDLGLASYVADIKKPSVVIDFLQERRFKVPREIIDRRLVSALGVPLMAKGNFKGVMVVYNTSQRSFDSFEMKLMSNFANQIANSLHLDYLSNVLGNFQKQWQVTFDAVPDRITLQDANHTIIMANKAAGENLDLQVSEIIGQRCSWIFHNSKEPIEGCPVKESLRTKKPAYAELGEGEDKCRIWSYPILDESGNIYLVAEYVKKFINRA